MILFGLKLIHYRVSIIILYLLDNITIFSLSRRFLFLKSYLCLTNIYRSSENTSPSPVSLLTRHIVSQSPSALAGYIHYWINIGFVVRWSHDMATLSYSPTIMWVTMCRHVWSTDTMTYSQQISVSDENRIRLTCRSLMRSWSQDERLTTNDNLWSTLRPWSIWLSAENSHTI